MDKIMVKTIISFPCVKGRNAVNFFNNTPKKYYLFFSIYIYGKL
jgi:hypothetical protein